MIGSTLTPVATAFALSIFSQLLKHSFQRIAQLVVSIVRAKYDDLNLAGTAAMGPDESDITVSLEHGKSIVSILLEHNISAVASEQEKHKPEQKQETESQRTNKSKALVPSGSSTPNKQRTRKVVDRRRRRKGGDENPSSEEESNSDSDDSVSNSGSLGRLSSDENLSVLLEDLGEDDLELLDSLSESSSSEPEEEVGDNMPGIQKIGKSPSSETNSSPTRRAGRRHIILAANFSMPPSSSHQGTGGGGGGAPEKSKPVATSEKIISGLGRTYPPSPPLPAPTITQSPGSNYCKADSQLGELMKSTVFQTAVYTACRLVAEESSLMALRVFIYWLQSYPIIIATCTQVK